MKLRPLDSVHPLPTYGRENVWLKYTQTRVLQTSGTTHLLVAYSVKYPIFHYTQSENYTQQRSLWAGKFPRDQKYFRK